ncbi:MAG TPA: C-terminal binding protein [Conexibacter sp.]|nr:C-terminal binding protein [Conexibacter sp.]
METVHKVVVGTQGFADTSLEREHLAGQPVEFVSAPLESAAQIASATADADAVIVTLERLGREQIAALGPRVRVIGRAGAGLDAIDLDAARERGIGVVHSPDYGTEEVATHAVALVLALQRRLVPAAAAVRDGWGDLGRLGTVVPLSSQTLGVVGVGRIGQRTLELLRPMVARALVYDPVAPAPDGATAVDALDDLLAQSDILTLHVPLTPSTHHLIGAEQIARIKRGAVLVNVARGELVDQAALVRGLESGALGGAALDVLEREPPAADDAILSAPNVLLTPHVAWYSTASVPRMRTITAEAVLSYLDGRPLRAGRIASAP